MTADLGLDPRRIDFSGDCWVWTGPRSLEGYGRVHLDGRQRQAHRVVWQHLHGPIPAGLFVCHACDNPPCIKPDHLFLGTPADNARDAQRKGRLGAGIPDRARRPHPWGNRRDEGRDAAVLASWMAGNTLATIGRSLGISRQRVQILRDRALRRRFVA